MAKKLNKNLVVTITVVGFILTTAAGILMVSQLKHTDPEEFARRAERELEKGQPESAAAFFSQAYRVSEKPKYLVRAANVLYDQGDEFKALKGYQDAVTQDPTLLEAQERVLELYLEMAAMSRSQTQGWIRVKETAEAILKLEGQEKNPRAIYGMGIALMGLEQLDANNAEQGAEYLREAIKLAPDDIEPVRELCGYYIRNKQIDKAKQTMQALIDRDPAPGQSAAEARCLMSNFLLQDRQYDKALSLLKEAQEFAGDDPEVKSFALTRLGLYWATRWRSAKAAEESQGTVGDAGVDIDIDKAFDSAESSFRQAIAVAPDEFEAYFQLAEILRLNQRLKDAIEVYEQRLAREFSRKGLKRNLVRFRCYRMYLSVADLYTAMASGQPAGSTDRDDLTTRANEYVERALGEFPDLPDASIARGKIEMARGRFREAVKFFETAGTQGNNTNWKTGYYLAQSLLQLRETGRAREAITRAMSIPDASMACWLLYARIEITMDEPAKALAATTQVLDRLPNNSEAKLLKAAAQEKMGLGEVAGKTIEGITNASPAVVAAQAQLLAQQGKPDEGLAKIEKALQKDPTNIKLVQAAAAIHYASGHPEKARRIITKALAQSPDTFELQVLDLQFSDIKPEERRQRYLAMVDKLDDAYLQAEYLTTYYRGEGEVEQQITYILKAIDLIKERATVAARNAGEVRLRSLVDQLFQLYATQKDFAALDVLVKRAADWNLDAAKGASYRGRRLMVDGFRFAQDAQTASREHRDDDAARFQKQSKNAYDQAIEALKTAIEEYPSSGHTYAELGEAYLQTQRVEDARMSFQQAYEILPRNGLILKRLATIALLTGNEDKFKEYVEQCRKLIPDDPWLAKQLLYLEEEDNPREVITKREKVRTDNPDDVQNIYALAKLYYRIGNATSAKQCIDEILKLAPDTSTVQQVTALLRNAGENNEALRILQEHLRLAPPKEKVMAQLMIADYYAAIGSQASDAAYLAAADIDANQKVCMAIGQHYLVTGRFTEANNWLAKAYAQAEKGSAVEKNAIQRMQVETLVRLEKMDEAQKLCDTYTRENPNDPSTLFLESQINYAQGQTEDAIKKLSRFLEKRPGHTFAIYRRAEYLGSLGKWQEVINDLDEMRASDPKALNYAPRILLARAYRRTGRADLAISELTSILNDDPTAARVVNELVQLYKKEKRFADADALLTRMLNDDPNNVIWLVNSAEVASKLKNRAKALANFKQAAKLAGYRPAYTIKFLNACQKSKLNAVEQGIAYLENEIPPDRRTPEVLLAHARLLADRGDTTNAAEEFCVAVHRAGLGDSVFQQQAALAAAQAFGMNQALKLFKQKPADAMFARASQHILMVLLNGHGDLDAARTLGEQLLETATNDAEKATTKLRLAEVYSKLGQTTKARKAYEDVLRFNKNDLVALNNLAFLLSDKINKPQEAIPYARHAAKLSPRPEVLDTLGWALLQAGKDRDAIAQLTKAREIDPTYVPATCHLAEACRKVGEFENAEKLFGEVLLTPEGGVYDEYRTLAQEGIRQAQERIAD